MFRLELFKRLHREFSSIDPELIPEPTGKVAPYEIELGVLSVDLRCVVFARAIMEQRYVHASNRTLSDLNQEQQLEHRRFVEVLREKCCLLNLIVNSSIGLIYKIPPGHVIDFREGWVVVACERGLAMEISNALNAQGIGPRQ